MIGLADKITLEPDGAIIVDHYRYALWRTLNSSLFASTDPGWLLYIGCNPSYGDALRNDTTLTLWNGITMRCGFARHLVANVHAHISSDPDDLRRVADPVGPENDRYLLEMIAISSKVVCCWGSIGAGPRATRVERMIRDAGKVPYALAVTKDGVPRHPIRLPKGFIRPLSELRAEVA
jgi:hypothetical protein